MLYFDCYYSHCRSTSFWEKFPFVYFSDVTSASRKILREREKMERGIENSRGMWHEGVARVVGCILSRMRSRRSLHSDVQHRWKTGGIEEASRGWMDASCKSEKRADKYKFLVFFRHSSHGVLSRLYAAHFKPLCISSLLTEGRDKVLLDCSHKDISRKSFFSLYLQSLSEGAT